MRLYIKLKLIIKRGDSLNKRAVLASQMTWIFILIAGAFIFLISFKLISIHKSVSQTKLAIQIASKLKANVATFSTTQNAYSSIQTFGGTIHNSCNGLVISSSQTLPIFVFSRDSLSSNSGFWNVFVHPFNFPMSSGNLVTIVDPQTVFVFVYDSNNASQVGIVNQVKSLLPSQNRTSVPVRIKDSSDISSALSFASSLKNNHFNIITFSDYSNSLPSNVNLYYVQYGSLQYNPDGTLSSGFGNVTFYKSKNGQAHREGVLSFFGFPLLASYVCSDFDVASCNLQKLLQGSYYTLNISAQRLLYLQQGFPECSQHFSYVVKDVAELNSVISKLLEQENYEKLNKYAHILWKEQIAVSSDNEALLEESCPTLY